MPKKKLQVIEKEYQTFLDDYVESYLVEEKQNYFSQLEPFEIWAAKQKKALQEQFYLFHEHFLAGFQVIIDELKKK
jgi:hypothetical protein